MGGATLCGFWRDTAPGRGFQGSNAWEFRWETPVRLAASKILATSVSSVRAVPRAAVATRGQPYARVEVPKFFPMRSAAMAQ